MLSISRLSDDVPVQSDSVPLINIYFTICMSFSLLAMIWFSLMNLLRENKRVPSCCRYIVLNYVCYLMCADKFESTKKESCSSQENSRKASGSSYRMNKNSDSLKRSSDNELRHLSYFPVQSFPNSSSANRITTSITNTNLKRNNSTFIPIEIKFNKKRSLYMSKNRNQSESGM